MKIIGSKSAARLLLVFVALGGSSLARADDYTVILKVGGGPCLTYAFAVADPATPATGVNVTLGSPSSQSASCALTDFPTTVDATVDVVAFGETEQGGPSRITNLAGTAGGLTISGSTWTNTTPEPDINGAYFIYNTNSVPAPAALSLLLLGGAGMLSARLLRRRGKK